MSSSPASPGAKQGLWGKLFGGRSRPSERSLSLAGGAVFGVALHESLVYASVAISQVGEDGKARIYGHIPVVVAKAGLFLKETGTTTPGIFRVSGSNKRIKELEQIFDTPPTYGKDLVWDSFSVHDAASAFRRYLNMLPFPIIPFELYSAFQDALPKDPQPTAERINAAIDRYRILINSLPPSSQHIFFYTLDLLSVFHRNSEQNLMPATNLATIFQPGLLRHPETPHKPIDASSDADAVKAQVEADATEMRNSQAVLVFLIEHQDAFELELPKPAPVKIPSDSKSVPAAGAAVQAPQLASQSGSSRRARRQSTEPPGATSPKSPPAGLSRGSAESPRLSTAPKKRPSTGDRKPDAEPTTPAPTVDQAP